MLQIILNFTKSLSSGLMCDRELITFFYVEELIPIIGVHHHAVGALAQKGMVVLACSMVAFAEGAHLCEFNGIPAVPPDGHWCPCFPRRGATLHDRLQKRVALGHRRCQYMRSVPPLSLRSRVRLQVIHCSSFVMITGLMLIG